MIGCGVKECNDVKAVDGKYDIYFLKCPEFNSLACLNSDITPDRSGNSEGGGAYQRAHVFQK